MYKGGKTSEYLCQRSDVVKTKKALTYFISFFSLSLMFSLCYYLSYKNALKHFNENAVERNKELILSLESNGLILTQDTKNNTNQLNTNDSEAVESNEDEDMVPVDTITYDTILPSTKYTLQDYDIKDGVMNEELLPTPSYLIGLKREEVIEYLHNYMQDLPYSEYEKGLTSYELISFSKDKVVLRKTYNIDKVDTRYYLILQNDFIVVYYGDQKTVYEYTGLSVDKLSQHERVQLENGIFVNNLTELYALLENYTS